MKKLTILSILTLVTFAFSSCTKKMCCTAPTPNDYLAAKKGSADWVTKFQETNTYNDSTYFFGRVGEENLVFRIKYNGTGKYPLSVSQSRYTLTVGGDVVVAEYYADPTAESVLNITSYDADKKIYYGNFNLNLKSAYRYNTGYPEKLAFTNGSFKITLSK